LDRRRLDWDGNWLGHLGLEARQLGALADFGDSVDRLSGPWAARWPALARARWFQPIGDGAAANVGSGVAGPGRVALTLGTTSALRAVPDAPPRQLPMGAWNYRVDRRRPLVGAALTEGGNVFDWACRLAGLEPGEALDAAMASRPAGSHGLTFIPHLAGERAPNWNDQARGTIAGVTLATDGIDIARAAVEGVAARLGLTLRMLGDIATGEIMASGGLLKSGFWRRMVTAGIGRPIRVCREAEATSRGAALLALEAMGAISMARIETPGQSTAEPDQGDVEALAAQAIRQEKLRALGVS
jgi:gluconokinase